VSFIALRAPLHQKQRLSFFVAIGSAAVLCVEFIRMPKIIGGLSIS
jgi:hypothetical protein